MKLTPQLDWTLIRQMAAYSAHAYAAATVFDQATDTQALVELNGGVVVVAFRGSSSARDFVQDVKARREELVWSLNDSPAEVHAGFLQSFEAVTVSVVQQVRELLDGLADPKVYITGHSLGGALAILCALEFHRQGLPVAGVFTFGQPRVGNKTFAVIYNEALKDVTFAMVNEGDPVPLLPTLLMGYRDCGHEVFLRRDEGVQFDPFIGWELALDIMGACQNWRQCRLALLPNHFIRTYQERIQLQMIP